MGVQAVSLQGVWHTEAVEYAADAVSAEAPEGTFAVRNNQLMESAQLMRSSRVQSELAAFPARPRVGSHLKEVRRLGLGECTERAAQVDQVQLGATGCSRSIRHVEVHVFELLSFAMSHQT